MQFTLGMPFLGVLGKFDRNLKGLIWASFQFKKEFIVLINYNTEWEYKLYFKSSEVTTKINIHLSFPLSHLHLHI